MNKTIKTEEYPFPVKHISKDEVLWCGADCRCICHQKDYEVPKDLKPIKESNLGEFVQKEGNEEKGLYQKIEEELHFLSQDGYGFRWREQKIEDICQIVADEIKKEKSKSYALGYDEAKGIYNDII